jgi:hypothetical protein
MAAPYNTVYESERNVCIPDTTLYIQKDIMKYEIRWFHVRMLYLVL